MESEKAETLKVNWQVKKLEFELPYMVWYLSIKQKCPFSNSLCHFSLHFSFSFALASVAGMEMDRTGPDQTRPVTRLYLPLANASVHTAMRRCGNWKCGRLNSSKGNLHKGKSKREQRKFSRCICHLIIDRRRRRCWLSKHFHWCIFPFPSIQSRVGCRYAACR